VHVLEVIDAIEDMGYRTLTRYGDSAQTRRALRCRPRAP
jgi:hypothetical protein